MSDANSGPASEAEIELVEFETVGTDAEGNIVIEDVVVATDAHGHVIATDETVAVIDAHGDAVIDETVLQILQYLEQRFGRDAVHRRAFAGVGRERGDELVG